MSYTARLEAHNDRIRKKVALESTSLADGREFITDDNLWSIWMRPVGEIDSKTELDEFQECIPSPDLARNLYSTIKTISVLISIHWRRWNEFAERFCRATHCSSLDEIQDLDSRLPFTKNEVYHRLFPDDHLSAQKFYTQQYVFLPIILEENQRFKFYEPEYRLPLLDDHGEGRPRPGERILPVRIAEGHFRLARTGELNAKPHALRRKRIRHLSDVEREIHNLVLLKNTEDASHRIMRHLVALKVGPEYNIFYGEAEMDLESLLNGHYTSWFPDTVMAPQILVGQACFLANAIDFLHSRMVDRRNRILCCHMDLKPANILIVRNKSLPVGKWMLSDFGITVVKVETQSGYLAADMYGDKPYIQPTVTKSVRYPSEYNPPEVEKRLSTDSEAEADDECKGDIWSFGCILATLLLFCLGGTPLVKRLQTMKRNEGQTDYFYATFNNGSRPVFRVKQQIKSWASQIGNHPGSWAIDWYQLIFDHMLLISPSQRIQARQIQEHLELVWTQAPTENVWGELPPNLDSRPLSPTFYNNEDKDDRSLYEAPASLNGLTNLKSPPSSNGPPSAHGPPSSNGISSSNGDRRPSLTSWLASKRNSIAPSIMSPISITSPSSMTSPQSIKSATFRSESRATTSPVRDVDTDPLMVVRDAREVDFSLLSPKRSDSTEGTIRSSMSAHGGPVDKLNLKNELPDADSLSICSDAARIIFWHGQSVLTYQRKSAMQNDSNPLFSRENVGFGDLGLKGQQNTQWIQATVAGSYMALVKSANSSLQVRVVDMDRGENAQPTTDWPSFSGLRSVSLSSQGSLALFYDKIVKFRCTKDYPNFKNSSWSTAPENICAAAFARDGRKFYAVSWNTLWIGTFDSNKWILKASGEHRLSARNYVSFAPYLVPFSTRVACLAHNPSEDKLRYLAPKVTIKVDIGSGIMRVALSDGEEMMMYIRKLSKKGKFGSQAYYGLAWRSIGKSQSGGITLGSESDVIDLDITVEKNKRFALTSSLEQGTLIAWVATAKGEIRKCRLT